MTYHKSLVPSNVYLHQKNFITVTHKYYLFFLSIVIVFNNLYLYNFNEGSKYLFILSGLFG